MPSLQTYHVLGIASGSELEGINASIITTDGVDVFEYGQNFDFPFDESFREELRQLHRKYPQIDEAERLRVEAEFTDFCISSVKEIISEDDKVNLIGFGGHIISHQPNEHILYQIGDCEKLARACKIALVGHLRDADMLSGGKGAPLSAIYHVALSQKLPKPLAWVDVGGVSALTYIGQNGEMSAFDTGPGNAIINEWVNKRSGIPMDYNGSLAISGHINDEVLSSLMRHKFLSLPPPKAADKSTFDDKSEHLAGLSLEDGAATATAFVADSIIKSIHDFLPELPQKVIICGGGSKNPTLMRFLKQRSAQIDFVSASDCGFAPQAIEAQAFGFLAVRRCNRMPTSYPFTTGAAFEVIGGEVFADF